MRSIRSSAALAVAATLVAAGMALADTVQPDGDLVAPGAQGVVDLGAVGPGAVITHDVGFTLVCFNLRHVDPGQTVTVTQGATFVPVEGGSISVTDATIGPLAAGSWVDDSVGPVGCPSALRLDANAPSTATIVAPPVPGLNYEFTVLFNKSLSPAGVFDGSSIGGPTALTFIVDVIDADTTPPVLHDVPQGLELVTSDPDGAVLDYALPTATDDRDPAPSVSCLPAPGAVAPVGSSSVTCTATDATGNVATAEFPVLVHLATVDWEEPVGAQAGIVVHGSRTIPVKVGAWLDGQPITSGTPELVVSTCSAGPGGGAEGWVTPVYQTDAGRWMGHLSTAGLVAGCHRVDLMAGGVSLGWFALTIDGPAAVKAGGPAAAANRAR